MLPISFGSFEIIKVELPQVIFSYLD